MQEERATGGGDGWRERDSGQQEGESGKRAIWRDARGEEAHAKRVAGRQTGDGGDWENKVLLREGVRGLRDGQKRHGFTRKSVSFLVFFGNNLPHHLIHIKET